MHAGAIPMPAASTHERTSHRAIHRTLQVAVVPTSLGLVLVARGDGGLSAVFLGDDDAALRADLAERYPSARVVEGDAATHALAARVARAVERPAERSDEPLDLQGTSFQRRVWQALREIPAGTTTTYGELARRIGAPGSVRAVGTACGANPVSVLVPCHRVVRGDGALAGYRWGLERKRALLDRERAAAQSDVGIMGA
jgi:AraC family transcriptional regulator, regulatory protein of adaptative response / methylated-DNA-[protein]-cysteine methyltransferase